MYQLNVIGNWHIQGDWKLYSKMNWDFNKYFN